MKILGNLVSRRALEIISCYIRVYSCLYFSVFSVFFCISCLSVFFLYLGDFFIIFCISPNFTLFFFRWNFNGSQIFRVCNLKKFRLRRAVIPSLFLLKVDIQFPSLNCIYGCPVTPLEILLLVDLKECTVVTKGCLLTIMIFFFRTNNNGSEVEYCLVVT